MQDTLFHKGDKVYFTEGPMRYKDGEVLNVMRSACGDGAVYYTVLVSEESGKGKNKKTVNTAVGGVVGTHLRKL